MSSMFEAALNALVTPVIVHGPTEILFANSAACRALRAPDPSALVGTAITSIVHPDGLDAGHHRRTLVLEHGQTIRDLPVKLMALDGTTVYARVEARRIEWADGMAILITAAILGN